MRLRGALALTLAVPMIVATIESKAVAATHDTAVACSTYTVGIDTSLTTTSGGDILGEAVGQTFFAADTLLKSLTVWRVASETPFGWGIKLFITHTDSTGYPLVNQIVLNGPDLYILNGDGIHPIKIEWVFDPPLSLPAKALYAFFLQIPPSQCPGYYDVLAREGGADAYTDGHAWWTSRSSFTGCGLRAPVNSNPVADIIFTAEFCDTHATPTRTTSWGELKQRYH